MAADDPEPTRHWLQRVAAGDSEAWRWLVEQHHARLHLYVLAMCHSRLGDPAQARDCFERAVRWQQRAKLQPADIEDLNELRAEAAALLGMAVGA